MTKKIVSMRVDDAFEKQLCNEAARRGFSKSEFILNCCSKIMDSDSKIDFAKEVKNQIELLCQLILYNPSWKDNEFLIKKETEFLWKLVFEKGPFLRP